MRENNISSRYEFLLNTNKKLANFSKNVQFDMFHIMI